jgi:hypothetical protein
LILIALIPSFNLSDATTEKHVVPIAAACSKVRDLSCGVHLCQQETAALRLDSLRFRFLFLPCTSELLVSRFIFYILDDLMRRLWGDFTLECTSDFADVASAFSVVGILRPLVKLGIFANEMGALDTVGFGEAATGQGTTAQ